MDHMHFPIAQRTSTRAREGRCPACGKRLGRADRQVSVAGVQFHRECAVYQSGRTAKRESS
jgi:hypothetical protein